MAKFAVYVTDLVIAAGAQQSNRTVAGELDDADSIELLAPDALTGTLSVQSGPNNDNSMNILQSPPGTDVLLTNAKSIVLTEVPYRQLAVLSAAAEGAIRTIRVRKQVK